MVPKFRAWHKTWEEMGKVKRIRFDDEGNVTTVLFEGKILGGCLESIYDMFDNSGAVETVSVCNKYNLLPKLNDWKNKILLCKTKI